MLDVYSPYSRYFNAGKDLPVYPAGGTLYQITDVTASIIHPNLQAQQLAFTIPMGSIIVIPIQVPNNSSIQISCDNAYGTTDFPVDMFVRNSSNNYIPWTYNAVENPNACSISFSAQAGNIYFVGIKGISTIEPITNRFLSYGGHVTISTWANLLPTANFHVFGGTVCKTEEGILFINESILHGSFVSVEWDFGDGSAPNNDYHPVHSYFSPGVRLVTLNVQTSSGNAQVEQYIKIVEGIESGGSMIVPHPVISYATDIIV